MDIFEEQITLEERSLSLHVDEYMNSYSHDKQEGKDLLTYKPERLLAAKYIQPMGDALKKWIKSLSSRPGRRSVAYQLLAEADPYEASYLAIRHLLSTFYQTPSLNTLAIGIGKTIHFNKLFKQFKVEFKRKAAQIDANVSTNPQWRKRVYKKFIDTEYQSNAALPPDPVLLSAGLLLIESFCSLSGLFNMESVVKKNSREKLLVPSPALLDWLDKAHKKAMVLDVSMPLCLLPPRDWEGITSGGYYTPTFQQQAPLIQTKHFTATKKKIEGQSPLVFKVVNQLQAIPWKVNPFIYQVLQDIYREGGSIGGAPPLDKESLFPVKPWSSEKQYEWCLNNTPNIVANWKQGMKSAHALWSRTISKREALFQRLEVGREFSGRPLYFVNFYDWRGRIYYQGNHTPQGDDCCKAFFQFHEEKPLKTDEAVYWLAVHGANCFGWDKIPFDERVKKVHEHSREIIACATNPLRERWWENADDPFQFLAFCDDWKRLRDKGTQATSGNPVRVDGSCNGLQHYSALLLDAVCAAAVNVSPSLTPQDVYGEVAKAVVKLLEEDDSDEAYAWEDKVDRKLVKRPVMTLPYSVTAYGMGQQIFEEVKARKEVDPYYLPDKQEMKLSVFLARKVVEALGEVTSSATQAMGWLKEVARIVVDSGQSVGWTTPVGFKVEQHYPKVKVKTVKTFFGGCRLRSYIPQETLEQKLSTNINGIAPNFIHSMDAAHLSLTCLTANAYDIRSLAFVHDSYGTHAVDIPKLNQILREQFVELYSVDRLKLFKEELEERTGLTLPDAPKRGTLDITSVLESSYFFS